MKLQNKPSSAGAEYATPPGLILFWFVVLQRCRAHDAHAARRRDMVRLSPRPPDVIEKAKSL
jgi:hypothetical protein